ncbi:MULTISPECIES: TetR/AcrR family transcriptional regulator [Frankia]|nr:MULTISPECIES: TetR/AcrR family transcriptional regulator [Frankia]
MSPESDLGRDARRRPMIDNTDPRAVRTRERLVAAFHEAVRVADPSEMSVSALARAAGINRTSFYTHFASPEDLAIYALGEVFDVVQGADIALRTRHGVSAAEASRRALRDIVRFVDSHRVVYARLLGPGAAPRLVQAIADAFTEHTVETLGRMDNRPPGVDITLTARFLAGGVLGVIGCWLADPPQRWPPERLIDALVLCLPGWLTAG